MLGWRPTACLGAEPVRHLRCTSVSVVVVAAVASVAGSAPRALAISTRRRTSGRAGGARERAPGTPLKLSRFAKGSAARCAARVRAGVCASPWRTECAKISKPISGRPGRGSDRRRRKNGGRQARGGGGHGACVRGERAHGRTGGGRRGLMSCWRRRAGEEGGAGEGLGVRERAPPRARARTQLLGPAGRAGRRARVVMLAWPLTEEGAREQY